MSDYISRQEACEVLDELASYYDHEMHEPMISNGIGTARAKLIDVPTVDAVSVVNCPQCAFCDRVPCPARDPETGKTRNCMKYCSIGERKDGEK